MNNLARKWVRRRYNLSMVDERQVWLYVSKRNRCVDLTLVEEWGGAERQKTCPCVTNLQAGIYLSISWPDTEINEALQSLTMLPPIKYAMHVLGLTQSLISSTERETVSLNQTQNFLRCQKQNAVFPFRGTD